MPAFSPPSVSYQASQRARATITFGGAASGTSTGTSATTLTDSGASWVTNSFAGATVYSNGKSGVVSSNTATVITVASWTGGTPASANTYIVTSLTSLDANYGYVGTQNLFTNNAGTGQGLCVVRLLLAEISVVLSSPGTGSMSLGVTSANTLFIGATAADGLGTPGFWIDTTGVIQTGKALPAALQNIVVGGSRNITLTVTTDQIISGKMIFDVFYDPVSIGGQNLSSAGGVS